MRLSLSDGKNSHLSKWTFKFVVFPLDLISFLQYLRSVVIVLFKKMFPHGTLVLLSWRHVECRIHNIGIDDIIEERAVSIYRLLHSNYGYFHIADISTSTLLRGVMRRHVGTVDDHGLLTRDAAYLRRQVPAFRKNLVSPSAG
jgi:hypothetical protein